MSFAVFSSGGALFARDSETMQMNSDSLISTNDFAERVATLEQVHTLQLFVLSGVALLIILFLIYRLCEYRRRFEQLEGKDDSKGKCLSVFSSPRSSNIIPDSSNQSFPVVEEEEVETVCCDSKVMELAARLDQLMQEEHLYREHFLTRDRVAAQLETNRTYIGQVMSNVYHVTFSQYVNDLRINEAISILDNPACKRPIRLIGQDLGFSSVTTFNAQFLKRAGMTPAQYRQSVLDKAQKSLS